MVFVVAEEASEVVVERVAELPELGEPAAYLTADLRELGRSEDEQRYHEHDQEVPGRQQAFHVARAYLRDEASAASRPTRLGACLRGEPGPLRW